MLTRLRSRALNLVGSGSNEDSAGESEMELDDSKVISGDWVFVREKRPQRRCTKRNSAQTDEWYTVTRKRNKIKPHSDLNLEYDTMDDLLQSEENVNTNSKNTSRESGFVGIQNNSVGTVLTRNQRRLMMAAEESKAMLERGTKSKRLQNVSFSGKSQNKHQNKVQMQGESNKRARKGHGKRGT